MRINILSRIILLVFFSFPLTAFPQIQNGNEIVVERSKEKTVIEGKTYYLHIVKKGENVYRISLAYGVTQKDIIAANPELLSTPVIKEGQILKIPTESSKAKNVQQIESDKYIFHIVETGQAILTLTEQYKLTKEELIKYNPELEMAPVLQAGQVVRIPKNRNIPAEQFTEHKVKKKDTKYGIAKKYDITVDELITANPVLNTEDLQPGQILKIPVKNGASVRTPVSENADTTDTVVKLDSIPCNPSLPPFIQTYNVAMLFPFCIEENQLLALVDSANTSRESSKIENNEVYQRTRNIMDFYQGALLALDSLKQAELSLNLYTYDTSRDTQKIARILNKPELSKMDLIIGPFFTEEVDKVAPFALNNKIKLVAPVTSNSHMLKNNPFIFQVLPNDTVNVEAMVNYIASIPNKNVLLVCSNNPRDKGIIDLFRKKLSTVLQTNYKEFFYKKYSDELTALLVENTDNIVIVPSEDQSFIGDIFSLLDVAAKTYSVKVIGLPICNMFDNVRQDYFYNLEFQYYSSFYANYTDPNILNFLSKYKNHFYSEPFYHNTRNYPYYLSKEGFNFAFLGYDITFHFLSLLGRYGKNFENCLNIQKFKLLHANFNFGRLYPNSGFINKHVNILKYTKDYYITKVN